VFFVHRGAFPHRLTPLYHTQKKNVKSGRKKLKKIFFDFFVPFLEEKEANPRTIYGILVLKSEFIYST
jgi:hypothetical protein